MLQVSWDWEGDGVWDTPLSTIKTEMHMYSVAGSYNVTLKVRDTDGKVGLSTLPLVVSPSSGEVPTVTTDSVIKITPSSATGGGEVTDVGSSNVSSRGVIWSQNMNPTIYDPHTEDGTGPGAFISELTGLEMNKRYYTKAYATNDLGTGYGYKISFIMANLSTGPCPGTPTITWYGQTYNTLEFGNQCWTK